MKENIETVRQYYNRGAEHEWDRLGQPETVRRGACPVPTH